MRFLLIPALLIALLPLSFGKEGELPPLDPDRKMYQMKDGFPSKAISWPILGGLQECRLPDPETVEELEKRLEMQAMRHAQEMKERDAERDAKQKEWETFWGGILKIAGWVLIAIGVACHACTNIGMVKSCGSSIFVLGLAGVIGGFGIQKTVEADKWLTVAFWGFAGLAIMVRYRKSSISRLWGIRSLLSWGQEKMDKYRKPEKPKEKGNQDGLG